MQTAIALTVAGSDPSGGAGIQADLKTFHAHAVYGQAVVTLLTVQNTLGVQRVEPVAPALIAEQIAALLEDAPPHAVKTGALSSGDAVRAIAAAFAGRGLPLIVDPVLRPTRGAAFAAEDLRAAYLEQLLPIATLLTPNAVEAKLLTGVEVEDEASAVAAAEHLLARGGDAVLIKGGHLPGEPVDVLVMRGAAPLLLRSERLATPHTHGTGCTYSAAITARLARGEPLAHAVREARAWLREVMQRPLGIGRGNGPLNHFVPPSDPQR